jgi:hypothetical protein
MIGDIDQKELLIDFDEAIRKFEQLREDGVANPLYEVWHEFYEKHQSLSISEDTPDYALTCRKESRPICEMDFIDGVANVHVMMGRLDLVDISAWAIPSPDIIAYIADVCQSSERKLIEIGAGSGYWLRLLSDAGVDCVGYDIPKNKFTRRYHDVHVGDESALAQHTKYNVLLCWPPQKGHTGEGMDARVLQRAELAERADIFYVGEPTWINQEGVAEACSTGTKEFFDILERDYELVRQIPLPKWPGLFDDFFHYRRRQPRA